MQTAAKIESVILTREETLWDWKHNGDLFICRHSLERIFGDDQVRMLKHVELCWTTDRLDVPVGTEPVEVKLSAIRVPDGGTHFLPAGMGLYWFVYIDPKNMADGYPLDTSDGNVFVGFRDFVQSLGFRYGGQVTLYVWLKLPREGGSRHTF